MLSNFTILQVQFKYNDMVNGDSFVNTFDFYENEILRKIFCHGILKLKPACYYRLKKLPNMVKFQFISAIQD